MHVHFLYFFLPEPRCIFTPFIGINLETNLGRIVFYHPVLVGSQVAADSSSAWHFLTEEKIPRTSGGIAACDEIGLDASYLVSAIVEQAVAVYGATRKKDAADRKKRPSCFGTTAPAAAAAAAGTDKKGAQVAGGVHRGRRRRRPLQTTVAAGDGPEAVRRLLCDVYTDAVAADIVGDTDLVRFVLGRLHAAAATPARFARPSRCGRRGLGPPLTLFLRQLYDVSHKNCWHLDEWRRRRDRDELRSLGAFARLLCQNDVRPTDALLDAIHKGKRFYKGPDSNSSPAIGTRS